mgnify:CR=1 FL=1
MKKITNHFLIALPNMIDPIFKRSIIYICDENKDGYMGLIINKPIANNNENIVDIGNIASNKFSNIYFGGPVNINAGIIIHDNSYSTEGTNQISTNISLTSDKKIIDDIAINNGPDNYKFFMGYSGWSPGQLEKEIENGDWILTSLDDKSIFNFSEEGKWKKLFLDFGLDITLFSDSPSGIS